jgi:gluconolactonase
MQMNFERVAGPYEGGTAGVVWDGSAILFAAAGEGRILRFDPKSSTTQDWRRYTSRTGGLALGGAGQLYGCQEASRRIAEFRTDGSVGALATMIDGKRPNFPKDVLVDGVGNVWFCDGSSPTRSFGPQMFPPLDYSAVMRIDRDPVTHQWRMHRMTYDTAAPRALAFSGDESILYVAEGAPDSAVRELRAYAIADGKLREPRVLHSFAADSRGPQAGIEGLCLDADGTILACAGRSDAGPGPLIYVFSPSGRVLATYEFPEDRPVRCAFGGETMSDLYVTSTAGNVWRARDVGRRGAERN